LIALNVSLTIKKLSAFSGTIKNLPTSKSISNRAIILNALTNNKSQLRNLSTANDTRLMQTFINSNQPVINIEDAGTTMRFLTAYYAVTGKTKTITGTDRMKQRPIGILVNALRKLGATIEYLEKDGFPPLQTNGFTQKTHEIFIRGDVSSQYISALMMIAPTLPSGLHIKFKGNVTSLPYIEMTTSLMKQFGVTCQANEHEIIIPHQAYSPTQLDIEYDWSAASYWFAFVALSQQAKIVLPNMPLRSLQGDKVIIDLMEPLGVKCEPRGNSLLLIKKEHQADMTWDFKNCPDLAQTIAVVCAAKGIHGVFNGLESLRIKETDRLTALSQELAKIGTKFKEENGVWVLTPAPQSTFYSTTFNTYLDHRMAMAFAPLAALTDITLENPHVVKKSYPLFWKDVQSLGFTLTEA
jgi:3-phosphoshikimate 1-carboxyvinyltransferase